MVRTGRHKGAARLRAGAAGRQRLRVVAPSILLPVRRSTGQEQSGRVSVGV